MGLHPYSLKLYEDLYSWCVHEAIMGLINSRIVASENDITVRDIIPNIDFGLESGYSFNIQQKKWTRLITVISDENFPKVFIFYGIKMYRQRSKIAQLRFNLESGGRCIMVKDIWVLENGIFLKRETKGRITHKLDGYIALQKRYPLFSHRDSFTIEAYGYENGIEKNTILLGLVAERRGVTVVRGE